MERFGNKYEIFSETWDTLVNLTGEKIDLSNQIPKTYGKHLAIYTDTQTHRNAFVISKMIACLNS